MHQSPTNLIIPTYYFIVLINYSEERYLLLILYRHWIEIFHCFNWRVRSHHVANPSNKPWHCFYIGNCLMYNVHTKAVKQDTKFNFTYNITCTLMFIFLNLKWNVMLVNNTFKYHVSCTDGKISVIINVLFYLYFSPSFHLIYVCFCPNQETEVTSTPTRSVENVVITTRGLQDRNNLLLDGRTVENKGKLIQ